MLLLIFVGGRGVCVCFIAFIAYITDELVSMLNLGYQDPNAVLSFVLTFKALSFHGDYTDFCFSVIKEILREFCSSVRGFR